MTTGTGNGGTSLGNAATAAGAEAPKNGAAGAQEPTKGADVGTGARAQGAGEQVGADAAAAELAGQPFTDVAQLKLADGFKLDEALMKDFLPLAKEHGFTAKQAQALVEFQATLAKKSDEARAAAQDAAAAKAVEALKKDPEIGGAKFDASMKLAGKALFKFGGAVDPKTGKSELVDAFNALELADGSMLGDNPVVARFLVNVGRALGEDATGAPKSGAAAKTALNDSATFNGEMYPNSPELKR